MKLQKPPSPPVPPSPEPSSGRARKDVNYVPQRRAPPLPSAHAPAPDEYDLVEDLATPIKASAPGPAPITDPTTGPSPPSVRDLARPPPPAAWEPGGSGPLPTGPMQPIAMPPPSHRGPAHFAPPSQQGMHAAPSASSARVRQVNPTDAAPHASQQGPVSSPISAQLTGPQLPVMQRPPGSTGPFPTAPSMVPPSSRGAGPDEGVPLGYVVASAFFLAIALVGFGLYLAFEVF